MPTLRYAMLRLGSHAPSILPQAKVAESGPSYFCIQKYIIFTIQSCLLPKVAKLAWKSTRCHAMRAGFNTAGCTASYCGPDVRKLGAGFKYELLCSHEHIFAQNSSQFLIGTVTVLCLRTYPKGYEESCYTLRACRSSRLYIPRRSLSMEKQLQTYFNTMRCALNVDQHPVKQITSL